MLKPQEIKENIWYKDALKIIAILTIVGTISAFLVKGLWYFYQFGYYKAIGVNQIYIQVDALGSLYEVIGYIGIGALIVLSNYYVFLLVKKRQIVGILYCFSMEIIAFFVSVLVGYNTSFWSAVNDIFLLKLFREYIVLMILLVFGVITINIPGLYLGITNFFQKSKDDKKIFRNIRFWLVVLVIEGVYIFGVGMVAGYQKTDFKIIIETVENKDRENIDSKYIIPVNEKPSRIYAVLYEDKENYVIAYLYNENGNAKIDKSHQKVISKINIETSYSEDVVKEYSTNIEKQVSEDKQNNNDKEMRSSMVDGLVGAIIGALIGGFITWFSTERAIKKQKQELQRNAASVLYYDLKSIETYFVEKISVNLRYSDKWQDMVANCTFLKDDEIKFVYQIYDEVYNYNHIYENNKSKKSEVKYQGNKLKEKLVNNQGVSKDEKNYTNEYSSLLNKLAEYNNK